MKNPPVASALLTRLLLGLLVFGVSACSLSDNPRRDERRSEYQRRRSSAHLLQDQKDIVADWDSRLSNDLADGSDWAKNFVAGRSLGGALVFMLSTLDRKVRPREFPVVSEELTVAEAVVSQRQNFLFYRTETAGKSRDWIGALPRPIPTPYAANKRSDLTQVKPFEILTEGQLSLVVWNPTQDVCCYFDSDTRQFVVSQIAIDASKNQVSRVVLKRLKPAIPFLSCESGRWSRDGSMFFSLWRKPRGQLVAWQYRFDNSLDSKKVGPDSGKDQNDKDVVGAELAAEQNVDPSFRAIEFPWPTVKTDSADGPPIWSVLSFLPCPHPRTINSNSAIVEAQQLNSEDRDSHRVFLWDWRRQKLSPLPALGDESGFAARWNGPSNFLVSRAQAGLGGERGGRWQEWTVDFYSRRQAEGQSRAPRVRFPRDFAAMDWNANGALMDQQLAWLLHGEVAAFIDPDTQRNIILSDHSGKNTLPLLLDRNRSTAQILSLQVVSVRSRPQDPESWRDYLYFVEEGVAGNVKRVDITPIGFGN